MAENENIEARLCSYVEGDLDAQDRAEIEKYLLANPQYRVLIEQLARTRGLLQGLPRAAAPAELLERLSSHLERSALLGAGEPSHTHLPPNRFPYVAAWAAVLVLATGLGLVIWRVLPSNKIQPELALLKSAPPPIAVTQPISGDFKPLALADGEKEFAAAPATAPAAPLAAPTDVSRAASAVVPATAPAAPAIAEATDAAVLTGAAPAGAVPTSLPPTTLPQTAVADQVASAPVAGEAKTGNFAAGAVALEPSNMNFTGGAVSGGIVSGDARQVGQNVYVTLHSNDARATGTQVAQYLSMNGMQFDTHPLDARIAQEPIDRRMNASGVASEPDRGRDLGLAVSPAAAAPSTAPAQRMMAGRVDTPALTFAAQAQPVARFDQGTVLIAHNLNFDQANKLASAFSVAIAPALPAESFPAETFPAGIAGAGRASDGALASGDRIRLIAREKLLPDIDAMNDTQTIDAQGNITLPLVGKVRAAGLTPQELAARLPQAYHDAKSPTDAVWTIDRLAALTFAAGQTRATPASAADSPTPAATTQNVSNAMSARISAGVSAAAPAATAPSVAESADKKSAQPGPLLDVTISVVNEAAPATQATEAAPAPADGLVPTTQASPPQAP